MRAKLALILARLPHGVSACGVSLTTAAAPGGATQAGCPLEVRSENHP